MKKSLLLGVAALNLNAVKSGVESSLDLSLMEHDSEYHGGVYFRGYCDGVSLVVQTNFVEDDGETTEAEFPDAAYLIYLEGESETVDQIAGRLKAIGTTLRMSIY